MNLTTIEEFKEPHPLFIEHGIDAVPYKHKDLKVGEVIFKG